MSRRDWEEKMANEKNEEMPSFGAEEALKYRTFDLFDIGNNDLQPLADWLEEGGELAPALRRDLTRLIRSGALDPAFKQWIQPSGTVLRGMARQRRDLEIGSWVSVRNFMSKRGTYPRISEKAAKKFLVSEGTVKRCFLKSRREIKRFERGDSSDPMSAILWLGHLEDFCEERGLDHNEIRVKMNSGQKFGLDF
jgi:hypothetical protein